MKLIIFTEYPTRRAIAVDFTTIKLIAENFTEIEDPKTNEMKDGYFCHIFTNIRVANSERGARISVMGTAKSVIRKIRNAQVICASMNLT